ncbi:hypothetical protein GCM10009654_33100 [Streptomyces hebeiensis]|uniref:ATPase AAA-type core domain-containing protein n=1 Tax=Streptomyces hebeiensis TaxID=229486 RepID=A0ABP4FHZ9_9ACTN
MPAVARIARAHGCGSGSPGRVAVLLLDEPTAGLDTTLRDEIANLLRHLATSRNLAVVLGTHDPTLVEACADHDRTPARKGEAGQRRGLS